MRKILLVLFSSVLLSSIQAQHSPIGKWKTIDDETGEEKSIVEIYERDGKVYGKITKLFRKPGQDPDPVCDKCDDDDPRYNQKIIGMEILKDMEKDGNEYSDGEILKPDEGKIYDCRIWREGDKLYVRGYWGFLYRTQEWVKYD